MYASPAGVTHQLVHDAFTKKKFKLWPLTPIAGGVLFSLSTVVLRGTPRIRLALQGLIGVGTIGMANAVATAAIVKERSHT